MTTGKLQDKARGMLIGLAIGDALGAPVEFGCSSRTICHMGDKIEHFQDCPAYPAGAWTDDTSMALCIADSLLEKGGYDSYDIMKRFSLWIYEGYRTFDGEPAIDVGNQTRIAVDVFQTNPIVPIDEPKTESAGNGAIMRLAPIIIANTSSNDLEQTLKMAELSCRETHNSVTAIAVTKVFAKALYYALQGEEKDKIIEKCKKGILGKGYDNLFGRALEKSGESLKDLGGYIVDCFAIALWGLINYNNFKDGMLAIIRLGGDTDTNAACYGQLAGAYYGYETIPDEWKDKVYSSIEIVNIADKLLNMKKCPIIKTRFEEDEHFKKS
jgi:ADP-ribosyl-[dinitrogen reductase] hydrolase